MKATLRPLPLILCLCLVLSGCASPSVARVVRDLVPRSSLPIVKIGLVAPFEGRYRAVGYDALYAVKWAVRQRNEAGGIAGYLVELVALDDGDDPDTLVVQARKLGIDTHVVGAVGPFSQAALLAVAPVYRALGLALVTPATCSQRLAEADYDGVVCNGGTDASLAEALAVRAAPYDQVALLQARDGPLSARLFPLVDEVFLPPWTPGAVARMAARPADVYLYDGDVLTAAELVVAMREAGIDVPVWGGPDLARVQMRQIAGQAARDVCYVLPVPALADLSPGSAFDVGYRELASAPPGPWAGLAYDAAERLLHAIEVAIEIDGEPTRAGVMRVLRAAHAPRPEIAFTCYGDD